MKILITGGKSAQALKLIKAFTNDEVWLADYGEMPRFASTAYQMCSLGERNDDTTAHNLLNRCLDEGIELVLPLHAFEIEAVAKSVVLFEEFGIKVLLPEMNILEKYLTTEKAVSSDWALFQEGSLLFASSPSDSLTEFGSTEQLNGVFHISETAGKTEAQLFTIR